MLLLYRVFYKLHRSDLPQKQVYNPFNLDGSPDTFIDPNVKYNAFSEYKYTAENLPQFTSFKIKVVMTDGTEFETKSTWGKENDTLKLDIDPKSHFAWTGGSQKVLDKGRVSRYNKKFSNLYFSSGKESAGC